MAEGQGARLGPRTVLAFGLGSFAEGIKSAAFGYLLLIYYQQVLGLSGTRAGLALALALVADAITDPLVGSISDRFRSRWGRRHPFMYGSAIPYGLVFLALFSPPAGLGQDGLFVWLTVFAIATRGILTLYSVPHMAMGAELTQRYDERTLLQSSRVGFSILGNIAVLMGGFLYFFAPSEAHPNGMFDSAAYTPFAATAAVLMAVTILLSALGTHDSIPRLQKAPAEFVPLRFARVRRELAEVWAVRPFRFLVGALLSYSALSGVLLALSVYVLKYFWQLSESFIGVQMSVSMGGLLFGALIATPIAQRAPRKRTLLGISMFWFAFFTSLLINLELMGLAPAIGSPLLHTLLMTFSAIGGIGTGGLAVFYSSMIADVTDEHERLHGSRQEGFYYSAISFAQKSVSGVGTLFAGIAIDLVGLVPGTAPEDASPAAVEALGWIYGPCVLVMLVVPLFLLRGYDIDRERHAAIRRELDQRSAERQAQS